MASLFARRQTTRRFDRNRPSSEQRRPARPADDFLLPLVPLRPADLSLASLFALFGCMPDDARDRRLATVGRFDSMEPATDFAPPKTDKEHD